VASGTGQTLNAVWGAPGVGPFFGGGNAARCSSTATAMLPIVTGNSNAI
jgi:hypothetical protein